MTRTDLDPTLDQLDESPEDARWRRLVDADASGELAPDAAAFVREHRGDGARARAERALLAELWSRAEGVDDRSAGAAADAAIVDAAVERFLAGGASPPTQPASRRWRPRLLVGGGLTAVLAAVASWLLLVSPPAEVVAPADAPAIAVADADPDPGSAPGGPRLLRGVATRRDDGSTIAAGARLDAGPALSLAEGACVGVPELFEGCPKGEATLSLRGSAIVALRGEFAFTARAPAASIVWVEVAGAEIRSDAAGAFSLVVEVDHWEVRAEEGELRVRLAGEADERRLAAGASLRVPPLAAEGEDAAAESEGAAAAAAANADTDAEGEGDASATAAENAAARVRPPGDPRALLAEAQALRGAGEYRGAARIYRRLIRDEGGRSSLARTAQVALGQLSLGPLGDPKRALAAFDAYLRGAADGPMAEEALYGKIEALRRLGRAEAAAAASDELLRRFPRSSYAAKIRARGG